jgi:hypothetical protein
LEGGKHFECNEYDRDRCVPKMSNSDKAEVFANRQNNNIRVLMKKRQTRKGFTQRYKEFAIITLAGVEKSCCHCRSKKSLGHTRVTRFQEKSLEQIRSQGLL